MKSACARPADSWISVKFDEGEVGGVELERQLIGD
jgi:hypothetical protein